MKETTFPRRVFLEGEVVAASGEALTGGYRTSIRKGVDTITRHGNTLDVDGPWGQDYRIEYAPRAPQK